jgi:hypothetical protein
MTGSEPGRLLDLLKRDVAETLGAVHRGVVDDCAAQLTMMIDRGVSAGGGEPS